MSETSSSEKPEVCWPSRSASMTVCVAVRRSQFSQSTSNNIHTTGTMVRGRTLSRLRIPA